MKFSSFKRDTELATHIFIFKWFMLNICYISGIQEQGINHIIFPQARLKLIYIVLHKVFDRSFLFFRTFCQ